MFLGALRFEMASADQYEFVLLAGADLIETISTPGVWSDKRSRSI
jgi:hypothetical protein